MNNFRTQSPRERSTNLPATGCMNHSHADSRFDSMRACVRAPLRAIRILNPPAEPQARNAMQHVLTQQMFSTPLLSDSSQLTKTPLLASWPITPQPNGLTRYQVWRASLRRLGILDDRTCGLELGTVRSCTCLRSKRVYAEVAQ